MTHRNIKIDAKQGYKKLINYIDILIYLCYKNILIISVRKMPF